MNIFWDKENHEFVAGLSDSNLVTRLDWILRDTVPVVLYIVTPSTTDQTYTPAAAPAGYSPRFSLKASGSFDGAALAAQATWTQTLDADSKIVYTANISLNTAALIAAVGALTELDLVGEFTLQDASGLNADSTQIDVRIKPDVHRATDVDPDALAPWWQEYTDAASGKKCLRIKNSDGETLVEFKPAGV